MAQDKGPGALVHYSQIRAESSLGLWECLPFQIQSLVSQTHCTSGTGEIKSLLPWWPLWIANVYSLVWLCIILEAPQEQKVFIWLRFFLNVTLKYFKGFCKQKKIQRIILYHTSTNQH